ncbi:MAG: hypothetical protein V7642_451 [Burkholderiales bacterium]
MADDNFFSRWSRRKVQAAQGKALPEAPEQQAGEQLEKQGPSSLMQPATPDTALPAQQPVSDQAKPQLTLEDVAALTRDSDYSAFMARGVDEHVKRSALKKLFSDPHFNVMDGLDTYIEDYNKFEPIPAAMLASLNHAKALLDPLGHLEKQVLPMADSAPGPDEAQDEAPAEVDGQETDTPESVASADASSGAPEQPGEPEPQADVAPEAAVDPTKPREARS